MKWVFISSNSVPVFNSFWLSNKRELQPSWFCIFSLNLKGFSVSGICWWSLFYQLCNCLLTQPSFCWQCQISAFFFFLSGLCFMNTDNSQDSRGREGTFFCSTLPLPPTHEHLDIYVQLCMWDDYHIFLITMLVFTRLLLDETYHLIKLLFDWLMMWYWF